MELPPKRITHTIVALHERWTGLPNSQFSPATLRDRQVAFVMNILAHAEGLVVSLACQAIPFDSPGIARTFVCGASTGCERGIPATGARYSVFTE